MPAISSAQTKNQKVPVAYELYCWKGNSGEWTFSLLPMTNRLKSPEEIFSEKEAIHGVNELKQRILRAQGNSTIFVMHKFSTTTAVIKGRERLETPPKEIIEEITTAAKSRKIRLDVLSEK